MVVLAAHYPHTAGVSQPSDRAAQRIGHTIAEHRGLRRHLHGRLNPATATGLALSLALGVILVAGLIVAALTYLIRSSTALADIDQSVGQWGVDHRSDWSTEAVELVTWLGDTRVVIGLAVVVGIAPFLAVVIAG